MINEIDFYGARIYAIPMRVRFRGIAVREGMLVEGPAGWGEFCPFADYDDTASASWLATTVEQCTLGWPEPVRSRIPVNCTVPVVDPERAYEITAGSGCRTAAETGTGIADSDGPVGRSRIQRGLEGCAGGRRQTIESEKIGGVAVGGVGEHVVGSLQSIRRGSVAGAGLGGSGRG